MEEVPGQSEVEEAPGQFSEAEGGRYQLHSYLYLQALDFKIYFNDLFVKWDCIESYDIYIFISLCLVEAILQIELFVVFINDDVTHLQYF